MAKPRLTDEDYRSKLIDAINEGEEEANFKTNFYQLLTTKYSIDKRRALKLHDRYYKDAIERRNEAKLAKGAELDLKAENDRSIKRTEALNILSDLSRGEPWESGGETISPTGSDRIRAIKTIAEMEGWNAPEKKDINFNQFQPPKIEFITNGECEVLPDDDSPKDEDND